MRNAYRPLSVTHATRITPRSLFHPSSSQYALILRGQGHAGRAPRRRKIAGRRWAALWAWYIAPAVCGPTAGQPGAQRVGGAVQDGAAADPAGARHRVHRDDAAVELEQDVAGQAHRRATSRIFSPRPLPARPGSRRGRAASPARPERKVARATKSATGYVSGRFTASARSVRARAVTAGTLPVRSAGFRRGQRGQKRQLHRPQIGSVAASSCIVIGLPAPV